MAMEMNVYETADFFIKYFLTIPFNYKDSVDAIYFYAFNNKKKYSDVVKLLNNLKENSSANTINKKNTRHIEQSILEIDNDEDLIKFLKNNTYSKEHQFQTAKNKIFKLIQDITSYTYDLI